MKGAVGGGRDGAVAGGPSPERVRMLEYLADRAAALGPAGIRARFQSAVAEFEAAIAGLGERDARRVAVPGEWTIAQVVDHLAQTVIRSADELRHVLAGRRPPGPPVYEALASGAATRVPWRELVAGLGEANAELDGLLATTIGAEPADTPTVRAILVVNRTAPSGRREPEVFDAEVSWRAYVLVQRLHALDHRTQVRALRTALGEPLERGSTAGTPPAL